MLKGEPQKVVVNVDETSATGYAALHNEVVNLRNIYDAEPASRVPVFNRAFDHQCGCLTNSLLAVPIRDPEGSVIGVITVANARKGYFSTDDQWFMENYATELALAVEKQKAIQQTVSALRLASIGETAAALSHCIKNVAQALRTGSHVIKRALRSGKVEDVKAAWDILDRHIERLADLSMDILAYDPLVRQYSEKGSLNKLVEHVLDLFKEEARARAVEVRFRKGDDVDPAKFDPLGIYRCLVNLISNALDACPLSDGMIVVSTERTSKAEFVITVADNGRGMDEKTKGSVFELFRTSKPRKGTGLGLPTVADIVEKHHGRIEIDTGPGKGTTFKLFIREGSATA
jgi:signal transduction histidine kinase